MAKSEYEKKLELSIKVNSALQLFRENVATGKIKPPKGRYSIDINTGEAHPIPDNQTPDIARRSLSQPGDHDFQGD